MEAARFERTVRTESSEIFAIYGLSLIHI